jgi:pyruvate kinase
MLDRLLAAGMDVARLNFSHGTHEQHARVIKDLRDLAKKRDRPLAILQDLSGPKVRLGMIAGGAVSLKRGQRITLTSRPVPGDSLEVHLPVPELLRAVRQGSRLLADDGKVEMEVVSCDGTDVVVKTIVPGDLGSRKGVSSPGVKLEIAAVTEKDLADLRFGLENGVDWVAASFIRGPEDLRPIYAEMERFGVARPVIAKIEKQEAVDRLREILAAVQGVMVARGDLGVEIPLDEVPIVQKRIIRRCNEAGKPVITATQMLDSMIQNPRPTRAEVTDVANAILDGTDAVMLSGETAAGNYPVAAVKMMSRVAVRADALLTEEYYHRASTKSQALDNTDAVAQATVELARDVKAAAILCATTSGSSARRIARYRPPMKLVAATPVEESFRQLSLSWGVWPILIQPVNSSDQMMERTINAAVESGVVKRGDRVVLTAGVPVNVIGNTNLIRVHCVGDPVVPSKG